MTTAKRTTLVRHLHLDIGYEQDISPSVLAGAILEALEPDIIDEMGILFVQAQNPYESNEGSLTIYAPIDEVNLSEPAADGGPPETPLSTEQVPQYNELIATVLEEQAEERVGATKVCPDCGYGADLDAPPVPRDPSERREEVLEVCDDCKRKPNVGG